MDQLYPKDQDSPDAVSSKERRRKLELGETEIKYAFRTDVGSLRREHMYAEWPSIERVDDVWKEGAAIIRETSPGTVKEEDLIYFLVQRLPEASMSLRIEPFGPIDNDFSEGKSEPVCRCFMVLIV
jgi:hypothetical protein